MGDPVTQAMFFQALDQMRKDFEERHRHIRDDINEGFRSLGDKLDNHAAEDRDVERRVQYMENSAQFVKESARKSAAWYALGISSLVGVLIEGIRHIFLRP